MVIVRQEANWTGYTGAERVNRPFIVKQEVGLISWDSIVKDSG